MLSSIDTEKAIFKTLQTYLCTNVWNTPLTECRRNIVLRAINKGWSFINTVDLGCMSVDLPYKTDSLKKSFRIYAADKHCMGGLIVDLDWNVLKEQLKVSQISESDMNSIKDMYNSGWLPLDKYLNLRPFDLRIHGRHGECLYRGDIFIRNHPYMDMFLIAIETKMAKQILGDGYDYMNVYMSVYYDSDYNLTTLSNDSPMIECFHPTTGQVDVLNAAFAAYTRRSQTILPGETCSERDRTICFVDGREAVPASLSDIKTGQYIEIVYDPDVICSLTMDLTDPTQSHVFRSVIDSTYKYIVHIPKEINPDNYIITHNTCDIFIRPTNTDEVENARLKGLFMHRFNTGVRDEKQVLHDYMITQLTHNDFCVSDKLVSSYLEYIGSSECVLRVIVRRHSKAIKLDVDSNYLKILYDFDDTAILKFLTGSGDETLDFWKAEKLETSEFCKMTMSVPTEITQENVTRYMNALGYYNTMSIITPRVKHAIKDLDEHRTFCVDIPISMLACDQIYPLVYINGKKIDDGLRTFVRKYQFVEITLSNEVSWSNGDELEVELIDVPKQFCYCEVPGSDHQTTREIQTDIDIDVYEVTSESPTSDYFIDRFTQPDDHTGRSYRKIEDFSEIFQGDAILSSDEYVVTPDLVFLNNKVYYTFNSEEGAYEVARVDVGTDIPNSTTYYELQSGLRKHYIWEATTYGKTYLICTKSTFRRIITTEQYSGVIPEPDPEKTITMTVGLDDFAALELYNGKLYARFIPGDDLGIHHDLPGDVKFDRSACFIDGNVWYTDDGPIEIGNFDKIKSVVIRQGRDGYATADRDEAIDEYNFNDELYDYIDSHLFDFFVRCGVVYSDTRLVLFDFRGSSDKYVIEITFTNEASGNVPVGQNETNVGTCTDLLYSIPETLPASYIAQGNSSAARSVLPFINEDWNIIVFINGRELVENVDYLRKQITGQNGVQNTVITYSNQSYLRIGNNQLEVYITSDQEFLNANGFAHAIYHNTPTTSTFLYGIIEEAAPYVLWFERLCTLAIHGLHRSDVYRNNGYLRLSEECRQGGIYVARGLISREILKFMDRYISMDEDLRKLTNIDKYLRSLDSGLTTDIERIPESHHITSLTMAAVVNDVLKGLKTLNYSPDYMSMLNQVTEYLPIKNYDAAMNGISTELYVTNAGVLKANNAFKIADTTKKGSERKWINTTYKLQIAWNCANGLHRWELKSVVAHDIEVLYYAEDLHGDQQPWKLTWVAAKQDYVPAPKVESGALDLTYIDLFPSYSSDLHIVTDDRSLRQVMKALFPTDNIRDGATVI